MARRRSTQSGFTLIEVLASLAIASLGLGALVASVGTGLGNSDAADRYLEATRRAQTRLALVGTVMPLIPGDRSGEDGNGFTWRVRISPPVLYPPTRASVGEKLPALYPVEVTVSWSAATTTRSVSLQSQLLGRADNG